MTDPRAVARIRAQEIISRMWSDWTLIADEKHPEKWACVKPTELLEEFTHALSDERRRGMEEAAKLVPTNWVDPLLTGPNSLSVTGYKKTGGNLYNCRSIEQLLRSIQDRIRAQAEAGQEAAKVICPYCNDPRWPQSVIVKGRAVHVSPVTRSFLPCNAMQIHAAIRAHIQEAQHGK